MNVEELIDKLKKPEYEGWKVKFRSVNNHGYKLDNDVDYIITDDKELKTLILCEEWL